MFPCKLTWLSFLFLFLLFKSPASGQLNDHVLQQLKARLTGDEEIDVEGWLDLLSGISHDKLDVNQCSVDELHSLGILTDLQVVDLVAYRDILGPLIDIHELQAIPGFTLEDVLLIREFLSTGEKGQTPVLTTDFLRESSHTVFLRWHRTLEKQKGYIAADDTTYAAYTGDAGAFMLKYRFNAGKFFQAGFLAEKDPGERFFNASHLGFDHYGAYVAVKKLRPWLSQVIIGDFKANLGQGLISHGAFLSGRSSAALQISKSGTVFNKFSSSTEYGYLRGLASSFRLGKISIHLFGSANKVDSNLEQLSTADSIAESPIIAMTSIIQTGYHRSESEIKDRKNQWHYTLGTGIRFNTTNADLGLNLCFDRLTYPFAVSEKLYQLYRPNQNKFFAGSFDHRIRIKNMLLSGELAYSWRGGIAWNQSLQASLSKDLDIGLLARYYQSNYFVLNGKGFGASSSNNNETGVYMGMVFRPVKRWKISAYIDTWYYPWLKYNIDAPTLGHALLLRIDYSIKRRMQVYTLFTQTIKQKNGDIGPGGTSAIIEQQQNRLSMHIAYKISRNLESRNRLEWRFLNGFSDRSFLLYQDVLYKPVGSPFSFTLRYAVFDSPSYENRVYAYENDLLYNSSTPAYYKKGIRMYINLRYKLTRHITAEMRYALSHYPFETSVSSGQEEIQESKRSMLKVQLRFSY